MAAYQADSMDQCKDCEGDRQPKSTISSSQDDRCCNTCPIQQESGAFEPSELVLGRLNGPEVTASHTSSTKLGSGNIRNSTNFLLKATTNIIRVEILVNF